MTPPNPTDDIDWSLIMDALAQARFALDSAEPMAGRMVLRADEVEVTHVIRRLTRAAVEVVRANEATQQLNQPITQSRSQEQDNDDQ